MTKPRGEEHVRPEEPGDGTLGDAIRASGGGLWFASTYWTDPATIVRRLSAVRPAGLRLHAGDVAFLADLPWLRFLILESDGGGPILDPVARLPGLEALLLEGLRAIRGDLDPAVLPGLRWFSAGLGGAGGAALWERLGRGHPRLEWLSLGAVPFRRIAEAAGAFPRLRHLRLGFADRLREPGDLGAVRATLRGLHVGGIRSLAGIEVVDRLEALTVAPVPPGALSAVAALPSLRFARLLGRELDIEPLRGHPRLRMLWLTRVDAAALDVLGSMPSLVAVGGAAPGTAMPWADLRTHPEARGEWRRAMAG